jgi:N utilization substance protein A
VQTIELNEEEKAMTIIVADDQLSLAIGKKGQNARLASKLTGWKIDLVCESDRKKAREVTMMLVAITELPGVDEDLAANLMAHGLNTIQDLAGSNRQALVEVPGIDDETAGELLETARSFLAALRSELAARGEAELLEEEEEEEPEEAPAPRSPDDEIVTEEMVEEAARRRAMAAAQPSEEAADAAEDEMDEMDETETAEEGETPESAVSPDLEGTEDEPRPE